MNWYLTDDAFYYFKTAQNIVEGKGITFDGINPTNGFHPLWMIFCVPIFALAKVNLFLPLRIVAVVQIFLNAVSGFFLFDLVQSKISKPIAWAAALFWMFFPSIHGVTTKLGLETGLNACMLIIFINLLSKIPWNANERKIRKSLFLVGLCGVGVLFSRLDNIFILILAGFWLIFHGRSINKISQLDFLLILISAIASYFIRLSSYKNIFDYLDFLYVLIAGSLVIKPIMLYLLQTYSVGKEKNNFLMILNSASAITISSVLLFLMMNVLQNVLHVIQGFPRTILLFDWVISLILIGSHHFIQQVIAKKNNQLIEDLSLKTNLGTWVKRAFVYYSLIVFSLGAYLLINYQYAGTAMPVSGQIKRWWGTLPNSVYGQPERTLTSVLQSMINPNRMTGPYWLFTQPINSAVRFLEKIFGLQTAGNPILNIFFLVIICGVLGYLVFLLFKNRSQENKTIFADMPMLPIFVGTLFHALFYKSTGYLHAKEWYWIGEMVLVVLLYSVLLALVLEFAMKKFHKREFVPVLIGILCLFLWGKFSMSIYQQYPLNGQVPFEYNLEGEVEFISDETSPGDVIGMTGGGLIAYFVPNRTILNLDGLINSADYFSKLKSGTTTEYLIEKNVKYIYGEELVLLDSDPYRWIFTDTLSVSAQGPYFILYSYQPLSN